MVSLDNFILFDTPYSSCDNNDYIGSSTVRVFSSYYLLGCNRLYSNQGGYWVLKAVLVDDKLVTDYSFEDIKILDEQILILSAFDRAVTVQWETLWDYFKLPSMAELNEISRKLTDRKIECYNNPLKTIDYKHAVDEMRLSTGLSEELQVRNTNLPLAEYVDRMCSMYHSRLNRESVVRYATIIHNYHNPVVEEVSSEESQYQDSLNFFTQSTGLLESGILPEDDEILETYINSLSELDYDDTGITVDDITRHATIVYNYHRSTQPAVEEVIDHLY